MEWFIYLLYIYNYSLVFGSEIRQVHLGWSQAHPRLEVTPPPGPAPHLESDQIFQNLPQWKYHIHLVGHLNLLLNKWL